MVYLLHILFSCNSDDLSAVFHHFSVCYFNDVKIDQFKMLLFKWCTISQTERSGKLVIYCCFRREKIRWELPPFSWKSSLNLAWQVTGSRRHRGLYKPYIKICHRMSEVISWRTFPCPFAVLFPMYVMRCLCPCTLHAHLCLSLLFAPLLQGMSYCCLLIPCAGDFLPFPATLPSVLFSLGVILCTSQ